MIAKEKAIELVEKYKKVDINKIEFCWVCDDGAKQCALIAVDEIISVVDMCIPYHNEETYRRYWEEVKQEIEKL